MLETLGDDADRVQRLRAAAAALAEQFAGPERPLIPHAVLAAADTENVDSALGDLAQEVLVAQWETLANAYPERPRELLRAVLIAALADAADRDAGVRLAAWYTLRTVLERGGGDRWVDPLSGLLATWQPAVEEQVKELWQPAPASSTLRMPAVGDPEHFTMKRRDEIVARAKEAEASGNYTTFSSQLQTMYSQQLLGVIELAEGAGNVGAQRAVAEVKTALSTLGTKLREAFQLHERGLEAVRLRGELMWWQQSRYSPLLERGYAELGGAAEVVIAAAIDLHSLVPAVAPPAAEHVLAGLVRAMAAADAPLTVAELHSAEAAAQLPGGDQGLTPRTLTSAVRTGDAEGAARALNVHDGIEAGTAAVIVFRDLQAAKAATAVDG